MRFVSYGWGSAISFVPSFIFAAYAWRLHSGTGNKRQHVGRVVVWATLAGAGQGVVQWALWRLVPPTGVVFGTPVENIPFPLLQSLVSNTLLALFLFVPMRAVVNVHAAGHHQLRWRLTFSYLVVGVVTSVLIPVAFMLIAAVLGALFAPALPLFTTTPHDAAMALAPLVERGASTAELSAALQGIKDGSIRVPNAPQPSAESDAAQSSMSLSSVDQLIMLRPDNMVLASTGTNAPAPGSVMPSKDLAQIAILHEQARPGACSEGTPAGTIQPDRAVCFITNAQGTTVAVLVAQGPALADNAQGLTPSTAQLVLLVVFGGLIVLLLTPLAMIVILPVAGGGVGYLLAGRLTKRLERLTAAAGDIAAGNLARRVPIDSEDEVGRLATDFNTMAVKLAEREHALAEAAQRAEALLRANKRLVADVSHELRTPLTTVRGYLEALAHEHGDKLPQRDLQVIESELQRLTHLIEDLFTLARTEAQQLPLQIGPTDVHALATKLVNALAPLARRERQIEIIAALPDALPHVCADETRLEQVLQNLLQNALRYTPAGGIVALEATIADDHVTLAVADTGMGIAPDELPRVWERFYRSDRSRARETGGAGLGLALVKELVTAMGGTVSAESAVGRGSKFSITLQRAR
jgi:signal transduction histidine kinase